MMTSKTKNFQVLAKSKPENSLAQHIDDCLNICEQLLLCFSHLPVQNKLLFWSTLRDALIFHDTGKSHPEFQRILYGMKTASNAWHYQRHELFSLFYIYQSFGEEKYKKQLCYIVAGHHKSIEDVLHFSEQAYDDNYSGFFGSDGMLSYEQECNKLWKNKTWKILAGYGFSKKTDANIPLLTVLHDIYQERITLKNESFLWYLLLVGMVKQCDHLASAGITKLYKLSDIDFSFLFRYPLYAHQQSSFMTLGNVILSAPTGSGKTETSLLWLKKQLDVKGEGRAFYVLPYTASINAMYERLTKQFENQVSLVGMLHGKVAQYIEEKFSADQSFASSLRNQLLQDFKTLVTPFKIVTPFQLLKHLFGLKGFEKGIVEWSGGYFIFDEIHAYDSATFAQIVVLLEFCVKQMSATVFIMTATLPSFMRMKLQNAIGGMSFIEADSNLYDSFDRHRLMIESGKLYASLSVIQRELDLGSKVLVVCNTVEQAQNVYKNLFAKSKLLIHGSFNAEDRSRKETRLQEEDIQLLVGTQAIEVSLDIDYDTIYTEPAPLDALIQRLGRVNRKRKKGICICHVFNESNDKDRFIYEQAVVERTLSVLLADVVNRNDGYIHERELQGLIDKVYPCWDEQQRQKYDLTYQSLSQGILNNLSPLAYNVKSEEDFYKQFNGVKVLPVSLRERYRHYCEEKMFVKAEGLMVSIRESRLFSLLNEGSIEQDLFVYEVDRANLFDKKQVTIIMKKYDSELGLQINTSDSFSDTFI